MAVCERCGNKVSWKVGHFGDHLCDDCRQAIAAEHAEAQANYQAVLDGLNGALNEVVTHLPEIRAREHPKALTEAEQTAMDVEALARFVQTQVGTVPFADWADHAITAVADALGARNGDSWKPEFQGIADELAIAGIRDGKARLAPISGDFVPDAREGALLTTPANRVWVVVDTELEFDQNAIEVGANKDVAFTKGKMRGREVVVRRRTVTQPGALYITNQRIVFVSPQPLIWARHGAVERIRAADKGELLFDVNNWDEPLRVRVAKPALVQACAEFAGAYARGTWVQPAFPPCPDTPPLDPQTEDLLGRAASAGVDPDDVRKARLLEHLGRLNRDWLTKFAASDTPSVPTDSDPQELRAVEATGGASDTPPSDPTPPSPQGQSSELHVRATESTGRIDLADLAVEILAVQTGNVPDWSGKPIVPHGVLVAVGLQVWNTTKSVQTFYSSMLELVEADETRYSARAGIGDDQITLLPRGAALSARTLQPKMPERGIVLFDIPPDIEIEALRVYETFGMGSDKPHTDISLAGFRSDRETPKTDDVEPTHNEPVALPASPTTTKAGTPAAERGPFPDVSKNLAITDYTDKQLRLVVRWVRSDGKERDDSALLIEVMRALGFSRRGSRVSERIGKAIRHEN
jgi:hypothetical protein